MKIRSKLLLLLLVTGLIPVLSVSGQGDIPVGTWRYHQVYRPTQSLAGSSSTVFALGDHSLFYFPVSSLEARTLTKQDGLFSHHFSQMAFEPQSKTLVLCYTDGTVDLIGESQIRTIHDIRTNAEFDDKRIHQIKLDGQSAWLATSFGLVLVHLGQGAIQEAYLNLGPGGTPLPILDLAFFEQQIWTSTPQGIFRANREDNLKDFRNWQPFSSPPQVQSLESLGPALFALTSAGRILQLENDSWVEIWGIAEVNSWKRIADALYFSNSTGIYRLYPDGSFEELVALAENPEDFHLSGQQLFLATPEGVQKHESAQSISPNGPLSAIQAFALVDGQPAALPNKISSNGQLLTSSSPLTSIFKNGQWVQLPAPDQVTGIVSQNGKYYFGTAGNGFWKSQDGELSQLSLQGLPSHATISDMAADHLGNTWIISADISGKVFKLSLEETLEEVDVSGLANPLKILIDRAGNLWLLQGNSSGSNLRLFNPASGLNRLLTTSENQGRLPTSRVLDIHLSFFGELWMGTENGPAYIPNPAMIQSGSAINAILPLFENRPLLQGLAIQALQTAPDGSLWLGTQREGLWHFSVDLEPLHHFQSTNSPLPANDIRQLVLDTKSGELFMITSQGALSYRGESIAQAERLSSLKIFPNPVRPNFSGLLSIEGLENNVTLKITNTAGRVMFSKQVLGGKTTWNLRNHEGSRMAPGVYMVYVVSENGNEKVAGKFLVL